MKKPLPATLLAVGQCLCSASRRGADGSGGHDHLGRCSVLPTQLLAGLTLLVITVMLVHFAGPGYTAGTAVLPCLVMEPLPH